MKIPNFSNARFVEKDGHLTEEWRHVLEQLFNELQQQMSDEGHVMPSQDATNVAVLDGDATKAGATLYNTTTKKAMINIDGTLKEIQTS